MTLYMFHGAGCEHCENMHPKVEKLKDEGYDITVLEVWHDEDNEQKMKEFDDVGCGGVPFFYDTENDDYICGEVGMDTLRHWAEGGAIEHNSSRKTRHKEKEGRL